MFSRLCLLLVAACLTAGLLGCGDNKKAETPAGVVPLESQDKKPPKPGSAQ
jgi:hypothetical protein